MAKIMELNEAEWNAKVATFPPLVQDVCKQLPPDRLYRMKSSGYRVVINSYNADGTLIVFLSGQFNLLLFERRMLGVLPADLTECDLPAGEAVGVQIRDPAEIQAAIEKIAQANQAVTRH